MNSKSAVSSQPWYREPWPWILMAGPFIVVIAGFITAYLAIVSNDGLVEDDYYRQGLTVNQRTARDHRAAELQFQADVMPGSDGVQLRVFVQSGSGAALPDELSLRLTHPTRSGTDQTVSLRADGSGFYSGRLLSPLTGRRHVALEDAQHEWRLLGVWEVEKQSMLQLGAAAKKAGGSSVVRSDNTGR